jgi:oxygen-independent coproporphyrinogen-3 oxidase
VQAAIGREQPLERIRGFIERARQRGFDSVNVDLIYGLPKQTASSWATTLAAIAELGPDRLACFGYAHLPARIKHQQAIDATTLPTAEQRLKLLLQANQFFTDHGYQAIGMDHFARPDDELSKARRDGRLWRSFMGYTTIRGVELVGVGCSAISELERLFCQNETHPDRYAELVRAGGGAIVRGHQLDDDDRYRKELISELMCNLEIRPVDIAERLGLPVPADIEAAVASLAPFEQEGLLEPLADGYRVTEVGQLFLRNLAMPFDRYLTEDNRQVFSRTV